MSTGTDVIRLNLFLAAFLRIMSETSAISSKTIVSLKTLHADWIAGRQTPTV